MEKNFRIVFVNFYKIFYYFFLEGGFVNALLPSRLGGIPLFIPFFPFTVGWIALRLRVDPATAAGQTDGRRRRLHHPNALHEIQSVFFVVLIGRQFQSSIQSVQLPTV